MDGAGAFSLLVGLAEANVMGTLEYALVSEEYTSSYLFVGRRKRKLARPKGRSRSSIICPPPNKHQGSRLDYKGRHRFIAHPSYGEGALARSTKRRGCVSMALFFTYLPLK